MRPPHSGAIYMVSSPQERSTQPFSPQERSTWASHPSKDLGGLPTQQRSTQPPHTGPRGLCLPLQGRT